MRNWGPPFLHGAGMFQAINRNKLSVALDLKNDAERETLTRYVLEEADIVVQNMRPGLVERYQLDAVRRCASAPSLVYCNMHGIRR